jgi:NAD(P)-dependent dehydrogenase (short-subunit alcohol dehydrogenase family)
MSPPIRLDVLAGHTAYYISKFGMTLVALGAAAEFRGTGVTANSLWPATVIESLGAYADCVLHRAATRIQFVFIPLSP